MATKDPFSGIPQIESGLKSHWYDVLQRINEDLAYIWSKPVKKDLEIMKKDLKKIRYILKRFASYYERMDKELFENELKDINGLISILDKAKPSDEWVRGANITLQKVLDEFEETKVGLRQHRGDLHVHSQDKLDGIPVSGSNCGALPVIEIIRYAGTRMGQEFIAITDHSRDADPKGALGYWGPKGRHDVAVYGMEERLVFMQE